MTTYDPQERWRREDEREREHVRRDEMPHESLARDAGDSRWGTGGMPEDRSVYPHGPHGMQVRKPPPPRRKPRRYDIPSSVAWAVDERIAGPYAGLGPRGYRRSDERVREDICERFTAHGYLDPRDVEVAVQGGRATLTGTLSTRAQKRLAEDIAQSVPGVTEVYNHLHVEPRTGGERPSRSSLPDEAGR